MPQFGEVRVDFITFTTGVSPEASVTVPVSGLVQNPTFSGDVVIKDNLDVEGNITVSGTVTGNAAGFTSVTGTTVTGTTANFVTISGTTVTGNTGNFTTVTTTTANVTSGIFASGTAAAPSVSVGTTNNGIYSPGANQVAISTAGTGRLFIDSNGNVGIGVSSITNVANRSQLVIGGTDGGLIDLSHGSTAAEGRIFVNDGELVLLAAESDGEIKFQTGGLNERFRIDSSGRLLAGTSSARTDLILGTRGGRVQVEAASSTAVDAIDNSSLCLTMGSSAPQGSANIFFTRTKSDSLGGVTSVGNNDILGGLYFQGTDGTDAVSAALIKAEVDGTPGANDMPGRIVLATTADGASSPTTRMTIDSSGNVGIGDTDPVYKLTVEGDGKFTDASNQTSDASGVLEIRCDHESTPVTENNNLLRLVSDTTNGYAAALIGLGKYQDNSNGRSELIFKVANTSLSSSLSEYKFKGNGEAIFPGTVFVGPFNTSSDSATGVRILKGTSSSNVVIQATAAASSTSTAFAVYKGQSSVASIKNDGSAQFDGSVSIGGTAAANIIDEYEEGTWTPTFAFATAGTTNIVYDNNTTSGTFGKYLKIGNIVHVWGRIKTSTFTFSGASGGARLEGLPYWATAPNESYGLNVQTYAGITGTPGDIIHLRSRGSSFFVFKRSSFGSSSVLDLGVAYFTSGTNLDLKFSGSFVTS